MPAMTHRLVRIVSIHLFTAIVALALATLLLRSGTGPATLQPQKHSMPIVLPLAFEPNAGQADKSVLFTARAMGGTLAFTPSGVALSRSSKNCTSDRSTCGDSINMGFIGSESDVRLEKSLQLPGKVNYLLGSDPSGWHTGLPTYSGINYRNLYPGIDLKYEGVDGRLKGTYAVAPGADPSRILWSYNGAESVAIDRQGNLQITPGGATDQSRNSGISELAPVAWQEIGGRRVSVSAQYVIGKNGAIGFSFGAYNREYPLTIDPTLTYSTFLGGGNDDIGYAITTGPAGIYLTGSTKALNFPLANAFQQTNHGVEDVFVSVLSPDGQTLLYSTYLGGGNNDIGRGIAVDPSGNIFVTGGTNSTSFPTTAGAFQPTSHGGTEVFVTKIDATGTNLLYSTFIGGTVNEQGDAIAIDGSGNAYITGFTTSSNFPTLNPFQPTIHSQQDIFVTKLNPAGSALVYSTYLGGSVGLGGNYDEGLGIAVHSGEAYVTGFTASTDFPTANAFQGVNGGQFDAFITHFNTTGNALIYSTFLGGNSDEESNGIVVDNQGKVYITGYTFSTNFPTAAPYQPNAQGGGDAFITQMNAAGTALVYSTYLGGSSYDYGQGIALDTAGDTYVIGTSGSSNFPRVNAIQNSLGGPQDIFVTKLNPAGSALFYSTYLGGNDYEHGFGIATNAQGDAILTGDTYSTNFPLANAYQPLPGDRIDAFVSVISDPLLTPTPAASATPIPTNTQVPTNTQLPTSTQTATNTHVPTNTQVPTGTQVPTSTQIPTGTRVPTNTSQPASPTASRTATSVQATATHPVSTNTAIVSATTIATTHPTDTAIIVTTPTHSPPTETQTAPPATETATACAIEFTDVPQGSTFYTFVRCLACRGIISGYNDGTFRPGNDVTRGQLSKIVSSAAGYSDDPGPQQFEDVPPDSTFYLWVQRLATRGFIGGYPCGGAGEPCGADNRPYFRPNATATRGQISKIVSNAAGYNNMPDSQTFEDVPPSHPFYLWVERLASRGTMGGYPCGSAGEPCGADNRPYFRPYNMATRGQVAKIVSNTFLPDCQSP